MPQRPGPGPRRAGWAPVSAGLYEITVNALLDRGVALGHAEWVSAGARVGAERMPALLAELADAELLTGDVLARAVAEAWSGPRHPARRLDPERWVELFGAAGYAVDGEPARRPAGPVRLYRGAHERDGAGLVWSGERHRDTVSTALAPPHALLARVTGGHGRPRYVVDPTRLGEVTPV